VLTTHSWVKSLWEQLRFYKFTIHLEYDRLDLPRRVNTLLVTMFWAAGYKGIGLVSLNRCCIAHKVIFLLVLVTACGRFLDTAFLVPPNSVYMIAAQSRYVFPNE
jgi:hypothetical protein